jgi:hypothetical protein
MKQAYSVLKIEGITTLAAAVALLLADNSVVEASFSTHEIESGNENETAIEICDQLAEKRACIVVLEDGSIQTFDDETAEAILSSYLTEEYELCKDHTFRKR